MANLSREARLGRNSPPGCVVNDDALNRLLRGFTVPIPSAAAQIRARHRSLLAFKASDALPPGTHVANRLGRLAGLAATVLALVVVAVVVRSWPLGTRENLAHDRQILREVEQLFPGQLNAIVLEGGRADLSLTQANGVGVSQPVLVVFRRSGETVRVLSFSGHHICVPLGARQACFDVLEGADGRIILAGDSGLLTPSSRRSVLGYSVHAERISL